MGTIEVVIGAGATGMAFTGALISHADVRVALLERRHAPGGHWLDAYPFVRLHQASAFYGVASTLLGDGRAQQHGPERGLHERATAAQICAYYYSVLTERLVASGRVSFMPGYVWTDDARCVSTISGERHDVRDPARVVNTHYLSPRIPATRMPPFAMDKEAKVIQVNELVRVADAPSEYVVVGSGKTATDACIWLLDRGVDPDRICWVRSREPWMLNRAMIRPDPTRASSSAPPPTPWSSWPRRPRSTDWLAMQVIGARAGAAFASDPDLKAWADTVALNPARTPTELAESAVMQQVLGRLRTSAGPALTRMAELAGIH